MTAVLFLIGFLTSIVGAISGFGGGVKPLLDLLSGLHVSTIGLMTSSTIFSMAAISLIRYPDKLKVLDLKKTSFLAFGGFVGGIAGKSLFSFLILRLSNDRLIGSIQSILMVLSLCFVMLFFFKKSKIRPLHAESAFLCVVLGILMGTLGSFIGISGGPINLVILYTFFGMDSKKSAINSLLIIFLAHGSNLLYSIVTSQIPEFEPLNLITLIVGGVSGGYVGSLVSGLFKNRSVDYLSISVLIFIMTLGIINTVRWLQ